MITCFFENPRYYYNISGKLPNTNILFLENPQVLSHYFGKIPRVRHHIILRISHNIYGKSQNIVKIFCLTFTSIFIKSQTSHYFFRNIAITCTVTGSENLLRVQFLYRMALKYPPKP